MLKINKLLIAIIFLLNIQTIYAYESLYGRAGLTYYDNNLSYNGYTLYSNKADTFLINMQGNIVKQWSGGVNPVILENGNLFDAVPDITGDVKGFYQLDWNNNKVWQYNNYRSNYRIHHDWIVIYNKALKENTILFIASKNISNQECIDNGCDIKYAPYSGVSIDGITEINMDGDIIWEWNFFDHIIQDFDSTKKNYVEPGKTIADYPNKLNINLDVRVTTFDGLHTNSIDYNPENGQIVINSIQGEFYVIDHDNTFIANNADESIKLAASSKGDFLYRFGDPARYDQGEIPSYNQDWLITSQGTKQIGGSHDVTWVKNKKTNRWNFLIYNNAHYLYLILPQSSILLVDPYIGKNSSISTNYVNPPEAGYHKSSIAISKRKIFYRNISNQIIWEYETKDNHNFFSHVIGGQQLLDNGNILICSGTQGHIFEVTNNGTLTWEFINPFTTVNKDGNILDDVSSANTISRIARYSYDDPRLKNKNILQNLTDFNPYVKNQEFSNYQDLVKTQNQFFNYFLSFLAGFLLSIVIIFTIKYNLRKKYKKQ